MFSTWMMLPWALSTSMKRLMWVPLNSFGKSTNMPIVATVFWIARSLSRTWIAAAATFRVATYNLNNYLDQPAAGRPAKTAEAKAVIRKSILALKPDVLAIQEIGSLPALLELKSSLRTDGLDLPFHDHISG